MGKLVVKPRPLNRSQPLEQLAELEARRELLALVDHLFLNMDMGLMGRQLARQRWKSID